MINTSSPTDSVNAIHADNKPLPESKPSATTAPELAAVLQAREERWQRRRSLTQQHQSNIISITMCLPLRYRTSSAYKALFYRLCQQVVEGLTKNSFSPIILPSCDGADGPAFFAVVSGSAHEVKKQCISLEDNLKQGRMLDIDLSDSYGNPVSRSDLGLPPRRCFVCKNPAAICVSRKLHSPAEIDLAVEQLLKQAESNTSL